MIITINGIATEVLIGKILLGLQEVPAIIYPAYYIGTTKIGKYNDGYEIEILYDFIKDKDNELSKTDIDMLSKYLRTY